MIVEYQDSVLTEEFLMGTDSGKRVLLVNTNMEKAPYPVPPLGLCLLAASLESEFTVKVYDGVFDEGRSLIALVDQFKPDFIGFSIRNIDDVVMDRQVFYIDGILKDFILPVRKHTSVPIILGGSGFSIFPKELMLLCEADYGVVGDAEHILPLLLQRLKNNECVGDLPNVLHTGNTSVKPGCYPDRRAGISLNFSEIDCRIDFQPYFNKGVYSIQTKRGCSHGCIYCTYPVIEGSVFRRRDPVEIVDEIEQTHHRIGPITFEFVDSTFNDPKGHAEAICREIINRRLKIRLRTMGINPRHSSEELFELMMEAGFAQIDATPDSASPTVIRNLDKGFDLHEVQQMAKLIRKFNLPTMWFFLFGGPGEDETTFRETLDFIDEYINPEDMVYMTAGLRIYPNTPLYQIALKEGKIRSDQSILTPSVFYYSDKIGKNRLDSLMNEASRDRYNCIPALETTPPPEMMSEAMQMRNSQQLTEPMFRTLLKIRKQWRIEGKI